MQNFPDSIRKKRLQELQRSVNPTSLIKQTGFIAQEVKIAAEKAGYDFNGVHEPDNQTDNWSLSYEKLTVPLVKAVQELSKMNEAKDSAITALKKQNEELEIRLDKIEKLLSQQAPNNISSSKKSSQTVELGMTAKLGQNIPNPFSSTTTIGYYLPSNKGTAYINFYATSGALIKSIKLSSQGSGTINVKASELPSGIYQYALVIDGKVIDRKQMVQGK